MAHDAKGVIDDVLNGDADAGIVFGSDAVRETARIRIAATTTEKDYRPILYYMQMERYCSNRELCQEFLACTQAAEAQEVLRPLGYGVPARPSIAPRSR